MSRTTRRSWVENNGKQPNIMYHSFKIKKEQEGRGIAMGCPYRDDCGWCDYKTVKYWDIKSGKNDWKD